MVAKEMYDYLSEVTVDYTLSELTIAPTNILVESAEKEQFVHKFSDGQRGVVTMSSNTHYIVTLQWDMLSLSDEGTIRDLWNDENKANGIAKSFYWDHPRDGHTYTVKFLSSLSSEHNYEYNERITIKQIQLDVLGVKPT